jgi:hypothetical protein
MTSGTCAGRFCLSRRQLLETASIENVYCPAREKNIHDAQFEKKFSLGPLIFLTTGTTNLSENQCRQVLVPCGFYGGSISTAFRAQKFSTSVDEHAVSMVDKNS